MGYYGSIRLLIYQPDTVKTNQALLFVNGGTRYNNPHGDNPPSHQLDFAHVKTETSLPLTQFNFNKKILRISQ